ncbi:septation ring formation regulator EzrA [Thalassobacillus devorans]|uniref:septation ring formation regulator EzrA n=1 Tax=Thalassobacillus devorans TaxID=279813 RepID=UPI00048CDE80|nr:septation ring formation regulator EzrA [Thalassobacillus devorans]
MEYLIGLILVIIGLIIYGLIARKKIYDEVDRLENWKMEIMNRKVTEELSKVKNLNLSGETHEKFETWRERWDSILTQELPDLEEDLFDVEEAADRYRFRKAKHKIQLIEKKLEDKEKDIEEIFKELEQLLESEESSRREVEHIEPLLNDLKKELVQNRHKYGKAYRAFDEEINTIQQTLDDYRNLVEQGDYMEAKQLVHQLKIILEELQQRISAFPLLYKKCRQEVPMQLDEILAGMAEMKEEGYRLNHLGFEKEIHNHRETLADCLTVMEQSSLDGVEDSITEIEVRIQEIYQLLEKEAIARNNIEKQYEPYQKVLEESEQILLATKEEVQELQRTYHFEDEDMEKQQLLEKWMVKIKKQFLDFQKKLEDDSTSYTDLQAKLEDCQKQLEELQVEHKQFSDRIRTLRKDENEAKEKLVSMQQSLLDINRKLNKSNMPGIPEELAVELKQAYEELQEVFMTLEQQPLEMTKVNAALDNASAKITHVTEAASYTMDQAQLAESVIQYGNRYRSQYPLIAARLSEAEREFRSYHYDTALEQAAEAIQEIDPDGLSRLKTQQNVLV